MKMNVGKGGKGQKGEREVGKKKGWRGDGEGENKIGEKVQKEGRGAIKPKATAERVNEKGWKGGNVEIGPEDEWRGSSVAEWKKEKKVPQKSKKSGESGESNDCKEEGKAPGEGNGEETERVEIPPKGSEVV